MNEESQSTEGSEESAAPAAGGAAVMSEDRYQENLEPPKAPREAPPEGTKYTWDDRMKVWHLRRDEHYKPAEDRTEAPADEPKQEGQEQEPKPGVQLPDLLPDHVRDNPEIQTLVTEGVAALSSSGEYNDEAMQRVVDLVSQFEVEIGTEQPPLYEEDRIRSMLKARWGSYYEGRLEKVNAFVNARPALKAYLNKTGAGNQLSVLEALGMVACGEMSHKPAEAAKLMAAMRNDPKSALRDAYHPGHKLAVRQAQVLADVIDRGEKAVEKKGSQGTVEELVTRRTAKEPAGDSPEAKIDSELRQLRLDPAYFDKSKPNHRAVIERVRELYRQRYPD